ncbi:MAG: TlpA family protein disulfide reductase [Bacteroidales bacterium]|nr:TlpA family protein disulfide reductase [Bacteroidales bacterium]
MVPQIPDTLNAEIVKLVEKSKGDTLTFQNMLSNMLNYAVKSNLMGMDRVTLTLSEKYYLSGEAYWADSALLAQLKTEVSKIKYNQVGDPARDLVVETLEGERLRVSTLPADYILLFFFEPTCGHCKVETPKLYKDVYQKYRNESFEVVCFYIQQDKDEWREFIDKNELYGWKNVWDPNRESYFWYFYDVSTTPGVYLINKDRKIMAKKISVETLDEILSREFGVE